MTASDPEANTMLAESATGAVRLGDAATLAPEGTEPVGANPVGTDPMARGARDPGQSEPAGLRRGSALGRYVVLDVLGRGGMGVVYSAYDPELDRKLAVKLVKWGGRSQTNASSGRSRLLREAQALAKLSHRNIVAVYDVGTYEDSIFVAMEFVEGRTLAQWIARGDDGPPHWRDVLAVFEPAGRALQAAHDAGIIHRDFKPENVMLDANGRVVVLDFGLARPTGSRATDRSPSQPSLSGSSSLALPLTVTGSVMGTPAYMSPEQLAGADTDAATDQFSFCVALYLALYGERPFSGDTLGELTASVFHDEVRPAPKGSRVPPWLRRALLRGLARRHDERFPSVNALLEALLDDPARRRRRMATGAITIGALALVAWGARALREDVDPCAEPLADLEQAWGPDRLASIESAFRRDTKAFSEHTLTLVGTALDDYAARWTRARMTACEALKAPTTVGANEAGIRAVCLDGGLRRLDALTRVLGEADQSTVEKALGAVQNLPPPEDCEDPRLDRRPPPVPDEPGLQERVEHLRIREAQVRALLETGRLHDARDLAEELLLEARAIGFQPAIGGMARLVGSAYLQFGRHAEAQALLEEAALVARAHGMNVLTWETQQQLVSYHTMISKDFALAEWLLRDVEALGKLLGDRPVNRAELLLARGRLEQHREHFAAAAEALETADALFEAHEGLGSSRVVALDLLASTYMELERPVDALEVLDRAERIATDTLGAAHPLRGNLLTHKARARAFQDRHDESVALLRTAAEVFEGAYGDVHPNISAVANGLGLQLESTGRPSEALEAFRRARTIAEQVFGNDHLQVAIIEQNMGNTLRRLGRADEALPLHRHAAIVREQSLPADALSRFDARDNLADDLRVLGRCDEADVEYRAVIDARERLGGIATPSLGYPLTGLALCRVARGELHQAIVDLERAVAVLSTEQGWDDALAPAKLALAVALRAAGREPDRVTALVGEAQRMLEEDALGYAPTLGQLRAFAAGEAIGTLLY